MGITSCRLYARSSVLCKSEKFTTTCVVHLVLFLHYRNVCVVHLDKNHLHTRKQHVDVYYLFRGKWPSSTNATYPSLEVPRFRDAYLAHDTDGSTIRFVVMTRTGGGNREDYMESHNGMRDCAGFLHDQDDEYAHSNAGTRQAAPVSGKAGPRTGEIDDYYKHVSQLPVCIQCIAIVVSKAGKKLRPTQSLHLRPHGDLFASRSQFLAVLHKLCISNHLCRPYVSFVPRAHNVKDQFHVLKPDGFSDRIAVTHCLLSQHNTKITYVRMCVQYTKKENYSITTCVGASATTVTKYGCPCCNPLLQINHRSPQEQQLCS